METKFHKLHFIHDNVTILSEGIILSTSKRKNVTESNEIISNLSYDGSTGPSRSSKKQVGFSSN
ncbi:hypothetical protein Hanom_Chr15g01394101 [Helianthus anomalus]